MERNHWKTLYQSCHRDLVQSLAEILEASRSAHLVSGPGPAPTDPKLVRPHEDEAKIALLDGGVDHLLDLCEETMQRQGLDVADRY